jgi:hypothetical protein
VQWIDGENLDPRSFENTQKKTARTSRSGTSIVGNVDILRPYYFVAQSISPFRALSRRTEEGDRR